MGAHWGPIDLLGEWFWGEEEERCRAEGRVGMQTMDKRAPPAAQTHPSGKGRAGELDTACSKTKQLKTPNMQHDTLKAFPQPFANPPKS